MTNITFPAKSLEAYQSLQKIPPGHLNLVKCVNEVQFYGLDSCAIVLVQGCFQSFQRRIDPQTWSFAVDRPIAVEKLAEKVLEHGCNQGIILSGGEPFWQARSLARLARKIKARGLFAISFTAFTLEKLCSHTAPLGAKELLESLDVLVAGPYIKSLAYHEDNSPLASRNQRVHIFNADFNDKISWSNPQRESASFEYKPI
ncbi:MAG: radical SAM protein [Cyanobacteria bacterium SBLK]|nr:radical SAM protein [Cyanobacteria bacterium SBLK]